MVSPFGASLAVRLAHQFSSPPGVAIVYGRAVSTPSNDPLHGVTLEHMVEALFERYGWTELCRRIPIRCFAYEPSVKSSLKFLRRTPWARAQVEELFVEERKLAARNRERNRRRAERRAHAAKCNEEQTSTPQAPAVEDEPVERASDGADES